MTDSQALPHLTPEAAAATLNFIGRAQYHPSEFQTFQQVSATLRAIAASGIRKEPAQPAAPEKPAPKPKAGRKAAAKG